MSAKVTVREIALAAGVSVATVSRAVNHPELVQPGKRNAVHRAIAALDYIPNRHARSLISQRSGAIGLLVPTLANPLFAPTVAAIEAALDATGHALLIHCTRRDPARQLKQIRHLLERGVDGLILTGTMDSPAEADLLGRTGVPYVVQDATLHATGIPSVAFDNAAAMAMAVDHLVDQGHRAIALFSGPIHNTAAVAERYAGAMRQMEARGVMPPPHWRVITDEYDGGSVRDGAAQLLDLSERPTAVACTGDILALGLAAECQRRAIALPRDLSVIGCGGTELSHYVEPALTTIGLPWDRMGTAAVDSLLALIAGQPAEKLVVLPHELIERRSVQPPCSR